MNREIRSGDKISVVPKQNQLLQITLPGREPLPDGVNAQKLGDRLVLRYPDGTEVSVKLD